MMKRIFAFIVFIACSAQIFCNEADTTLSYIETLPEIQQADTLKKIIKNNIFRDPKTTFVYVNKYSTLPEVLKDSSKICLSYYWTGMIYEMFGDYEKAIEYDFKSLEIAEKINNQKLTAITLNNIGLVYSYQQPFFHEALKYFRRYLAISTEINDENEIMGANMNIGMVYLNMSIPDSAEYYYRTAYSMARKLGNQYNIGLSYASLAGIEKLKHNIDLYYDYTHKAIGIYRREGYLVSLAAIYHEFSEWFFTQNIPDSALYYSNKMLDIADTYSLGNYKQNGLYQLSMIYYLVNDYQKAFETLHEHGMLKDSLSSEEIKEKLARLQTIYEVSIKDKEIENFRISQTLQDQKEQRLWLVLIIIIVASIAIILLVMVKRRKEKIVNEQKEVILKKEKELSILALEKSMAKEKELETELEFKARQLTSHAVSMMQKNKLMQELSANMQKVAKTANDDQKHEINKLQQQIKQSLNVEKDWELFKIYFEQVNKDFFTKLLEIEPSLSPNDLRLSALIRLNMNIKEAATVFNIEPASIKSARYRLRKKLGLNQEEDLYAYMRQI